MQRTLLALGLVVLSASAAHADVTSEARAGKLQCFEPDIQKKTCKGLFRIIVKPDGSSTSGGDLLLNVVNGSSVLAMRTPQSAVTIKGDTTCSVVRKSDIEGSVFLLDGKPVNAESARRIMDDMEARQAARFGTTECSVYTSAGAGAYLATDMVGGKAQPNSAHMVWVSPADGYRVAP